MLSVLLLMAGVTMSFAEVFSLVQEYSIPTEFRISNEPYATYRQWVTVNPNGTGVAFIDPEGKVIRSFDLAEGRPETVAPHTEVASLQWGPIRSNEDTVYLTESAAKVAGHGPRPEEVNAPVAVKYGRSGQLFVSDVANRRVSVFSPDGRFESSFLLSQMLSAPSDVAITADGNYLLASLRLDSVGSYNAGNLCNVVSPTGALVRSFAYTPKTAFDRNLWLGVYAVFDLDERYNAYVAFTVEPFIYVYDQTGEVRQVFGDVPDWWVPPPTLGKSKFNIRSEPPGFNGSWTRVIKLLCLDNKYLVRCTETNGLIEGCDQPYILDVFSTDGRLLAGGITTDYLPIGTSADSDLFLVTYHGDVLLRAKLTGLEER